MSDPALIHEAIIEAAARALTRWDGYDAEQWPAACHQAEAVLTVVTPLIRTAALEEAARLAEEYPWRGNDDPADIAAAIRALKPASPSPTDDSA